MLISSFFRRASKAFDLTEAAAKQVKKLLMGDFENRYLRIGLKEGGCAGFQYDFDFESKPKKGDHVFENHGASVILNDKALLFLRGGTLDFVSDKFSSTFKINLPESSGLHSCSCGKSVGTEDNKGACVHI